MARALAIVLALLTGITIFLFAARIWWMPPVSSVAGLSIDREFVAALLVLGIVFLAAQLALAIFIWKFRTGSRVEHSTGNRGAEIAWTLITAAVFITLALSAEHTWAELRRPPLPTNSDVEVEVTGTQFVWYFRYPGPDGKFGRTNTKDIDPTLGSAAALGVDRMDPDGKDDFVSSALVVPVGREVRLRLRAQDVIHSFFVPELRLKQDAVPGLNVEAHFRATRTGEYEIVCAELCGLGHYRMRGALKVVAAAEYSAWLAQHQGAAR
ncbi:MAG: cytochrome c oxidase subunit II [Terriglobales bacterium]|jgi:cytochrome c oxidase subunit 2